MYAKWTIKLETARIEALEIYERKVLGSVATEKERIEWVAATGVSLEGREQHGGAVREESAARLRPTSDSCRD